jgi:probable rRNA maturation factor
MMAKAGRVITVRNLQRGVTVDLPALRDFASHALERCSALPKRRDGLTSEINVLIISDRRSAELHRRFQQIAGPTDVITFQHGEIFISAQTAQRQAREFETSTQAEVELYLLHGLLHLHGFDDKRAAHARRMEKVQKKIFALIQAEPAFARRRSIE